MADDTMTFEAAAFTSLGTPREKVNLPAAYFDGTVNGPVMHRAVKAYLANQRQGNASTKTRGLVIGGNQKPWRQKGTGRARAGSIRSPLWPGGGTVFGPSPRSYEEKLPKKMRALARRSALNARAREEAIFVIDQFGYDTPHTKTLLALFDRLGVGGQKVLVLTDGIKPNVYLSGRNLPNVHVLPYVEASTYDVLWSDVVLIEAPAIGEALTPIAEKEAAPPRRAKVQSAAPKKSARKAAKAESKASATKAKVASKASAKSAKASSRARSAAKKSASKKSAPKKKKGK